MSTANQMNMKYRTLLVAFLAVGLITVTLVFLLRERRGDLQHSPYRDLLSLQKAPYEPGLKLRGEARAPGQDLFDTAMESYAADDFDRAISLLKKAVGQQPDSAAWWMYLGVCYYLNQEIQESISALERGNKVADAALKPYTRWYLANARLMAGERDPAEELLEILVHDKNTFSAQARDLLFKLRKVSPEATEGKPYVTYPAGGERFISGQTVTIKWGFDSPSDQIRYRIMLSGDGGITYDKNLALVHGSESEWSWQTAGLHGDKLCLRVDAVTPDSTILGVRSEIFSNSVPPWLTLESPKPGQTLRAGLQYKVQWRNIGSAPFYYKLILEQREGQEFSEVKTIARSIEPEEIALSWRNWAEPGSGYRLRLIAEYTDTTIACVSEKEFSVTSPVTLWLEEPEPPATTGWLENDPFGIEWEMKGDQPRKYSVELCDTLGVPVRTLAANLPGSTVNWSWIRRDVAGTYLVKVVAHYDEGDLAEFVSTPVAIQSGGSLAMPSPQEGTLPAVIDAPQLEQNFPNPYNSSTTIRFQITKPGPVKLRVFNIAGQLVRTAVDESMSEGTHSVSFDATNIASGLYVYQLETAGRTIQKKMMVVK